MCGSRGDGNGKKQSIQIWHQSCDLFSCIFHSFFIRFSFCMRPRIYYPAGDYDWITDLCAAFESIFYAIPTPNRLRCCCLSPLSLSVSLVHRMLIFNWITHTHIEFYGPTGAKWWSCVTVSFVVTWFYLFPYCSSLISLLISSFSSLFLPHSARATDTHCHSSRSISPTATRSYAQIIKNAFNVLDGVCSVVRHTHCYYKWFYCWPLFLCVWL